jgi:hypothetical protein
MLTFLDNYRDVSFPDLLFEDINFYETEAKARGFVRPTKDSHKWHLPRKYRVPRLHRRLPTPASVYSEIHVFVRLA